MDQSNFNLIFYNLSPGGPNIGNYVTCSVTKLLISTYVVMGFLAKIRFGEILLSGNSPEGLLDFWENKQTILLKKGVDKLFYSLCFAGLAELTDKDGKDEVRVGHELCEIFKTENILVPLHCFIVTEV